MAIFRNRKAPLAARKQSVLFPHQMIAVAAATKIRALPRQAQSPRHNKLCVAVAARRTPQITMKQPKWIDCPEPYTDEKDARYTWVQYLKPTLGVLVTQSISRPESNYSYESILLIRHLCHQYNEKEDRLVEFMQSSIGIWKLAKHKKKVGGIYFELEKWDVVEKWIEHMRAVMLTLNYDLKKWHKGFTCLSVLRNKELHPCHVVTSRDNNARYLCLAAHIRAGAGCGHGEEAIRVRVLALLPRCVNLICKEQASVNCVYPTHDILF